MGNIVKKFGLNAVKSYQKYISKDYNGARHAHCGYTPSCSQYALESINENGFFKGVADGFFRLMRCNKDARKVQIELFLTILNRSDYQNAVLDAVILKDPKIQDTISELREELGYLNTARTPKESYMQQDAVKKVLQGIDIKVINPVGGKDEEMKFILSPTKKEDNASACCEEHDVTACEVVEKFAGLLSACGYGIAGGAAGLVVGMVLGAVISWGARDAENLDSKVNNTDSKMDLLNKKISEKYSAYSIIGMVKKEKKIGLVSSRTESFLENFISNRKVASAIASIVGVPYGVLAGALGGALMSGEFFAKMGYYFGKNFTHEKLHTTHSPEQKPILSQNA